MTGPHRASASHVGDALVVCVALVSVAMHARGQPRDDARRPPSARTTLARSVTRTGPRLEVVGRAPTGVQPKSVNVSPDGSRIYVLDFGRRDRDNVRAYDARTLTQVATSTFPGNACESAFSPDGRTLWVSNFRLGKLEALDPTTLAVRAEVRVENNPKVVAVSPDGARVYVSNWSSASVSVIDARTLTVIRTLRTGAHPRGMAVRRDGTLLVTATQDDVVYEFDAHDLHEVRRIPTCQFPRHVVFAPGGERYIVSCSGSAHVAWYSFPSGAREGVAAVGMNPRTIDVSDDGRWVASADFTAKTVSLVDLRDRAVRTSEIPGAERIVGLVMAPGPAVRIYVTSWENGELIALEPR